MSSVAFVLGFTTVFVILGATATAAGQLLAANLPLLSKIAGAIIIIAGLHFLGVIHIPILHREARYHANARPAGLVGAYVIGLAFAFGWTPCIGPVLGAILAVAAGENSVRRSEEHTSELQSLRHLVCRLLLEKKKKKNTTNRNYIHHTKQK